MDKQPKVVFCVPTLTKPHPACLESLKKSIPVVKNAGWDESAVYEIGCPYISSARSKMLHKALAAGADVIVFIDHDLSWNPDDLLTLIETVGHVVAGTYRFKKDEEEYMGRPIYGEQGHPIVRKEDDCIQMHSIPAGFLKITKHAVNLLIKEFPELCYGDRVQPHFDIFNHGAHDWTWYGEDYAFSRRWREIGGEIWLRPNLNLTHHGDKPYPGNYHNYLLQKGLKDGDSN